ncbi:SusC/RagA family TonB-linked outer membrane protein [Chitinophaga defluvii]|uniref:SusC/RagA family TonB-linked outer membrane protein n=1 Tax=Chitinophaga defluvii TaxID=3163343 RepID=A0ABV2T8M0_9BACT
MKYFLLARKQVWSSIDYIVRRHFLVLIFAICIYEPSTAKSIKEPVFTLEMNQAPVEKAFKEIERQSSYRVLYYTNVLKTAHTVTISVKNVSLQTVLNIITDGQPFDYELKGKRIVLTPKNSNPQKLPVQAIIDTTITVTGTVSDEKTGQPLQGVTVLVKGTQNGAVTDQQGHFTFKSVSGPKTLLQIRNIGYETQEILIGKRTSLDITLSPSISSIKEISVMSTGYQSIPKERATGSFTQIDNALFNRSVSTNVLDRLDGVASGVNFTKNIPPGGNQSTITIRGISTINANSQPLIVVDGFPYEETLTGSQNILNNINPNDIQSITILKDAAASSIWGVRAGNGVIVITTKRGTYRQKTKIQFNSNITFGQRPDISNKTVPVISSKDEIDLEQTIFKNGYYQNIESYATIGYFSLLLPDAVELMIQNRDGKISSDELNSRLSKLSNNDVRSDINKYLLQTSINQQYALNVSGGSEKFNYYGSVGYDKNLSNTVGNTYNRLTIRFDNTYRPIKNLEINGYIVYTQSQNINNGLSINQFLPVGTGVAAYSMLAGNSGNSLSIPFGLRSAYLDTASYPALLDWHFRPLDEIKLKDNKSTQFDNRLGAELTYTFIPGLSVNAKYQYEKNLTINRIYNDRDAYYTRNIINKFMYNDPTGKTIYPVPLGGILQQGENIRTTWNFRSQLNFNHSWKNHNVIAIAGIETKQATSNGNSSQKYGFNLETNSFARTVDYSTNYNLNPTPYAGTSTVWNDFEAITGTVNRYVSYYGNGAYTFKEKYILSASGRIDHSNFFGIRANQRKVPLWSTGIAWNISEEPFYKIAWLPYLKIRGTYGYNGNTNNSATAYTTISYVSYPRIFSFDNPNFATIVSPPNPELRWEKVRVVNLGLDFNSKRDRFSGSLDFYRKTGLDLIGPIKTDPTTGVSEFSGNRANLITKGVDLVFNSTNINQELKWLTSVLFSFNKNKVSSYFYDYSSASSYISGAPMIGRPLYSVLSYRAASLNPKNGDPRAYLADTIADYNTVGYDASPTDLRFSGSQNPTIFGSIKNTFHYKRFSLSANITYKFGYYFRRNSINYSNLLSGWGGNTDYLLRWKSPGDEGKTMIPSLPSISDYNRDFVQLNSSNLVEKGDHVRLQDVRVSYNFQNLSKKPHLSNVQLYLYLNNVGILWRANKYKIDPDFVSPVYYTVPPGRTISVGFNANF